VATHALFQIKVHNFGNRYGFLDHGDIEFVNKAAVVFSSIVRTDQQFVSLVVNAHEVIVQSVPIDLNYLADLVECQTTKDQ